MLNEMKKLILVGTDHNDIEGAARLQRTLHRISKQVKPEDIFVAVEFAESTNNWMLSSRGRLAMELRRIAPEYNPTVTDALAETYGYEAEVVQNTLKGVKILWLEDDPNDGAQLTEEHILKKAEACVGRLRRIVAVPKNADLGEAKRLLARYCHNNSLEMAHADPITEFGAWFNYLSTAKTGSRDPKWVERIKTEVRSWEGKDFCGMIVIGDSHLLDIALPKILNVSKTVYGLLKDEYRTIELGRVWLHEQS